MFGVALGVGAGVAGDGVGVAVGGGGVRGATAGGALVAGALTVEMGDVAVASGGRDVGVPLTAAAASGGSGAA